MIRLDTTTAEIVSDIWTPTGETLLQLETGLSSVAVKIEARVSTDAPWTKIAMLHKSTAIQRIAALPFLRLTLHSNTAGQRVRVWDNA